MTTDRLPTRTRGGEAAVDVGAAAEALAPDVRGALAELLLTVADDEFVLGFLDSEWTGIAPMLEEDVAFSSLSQDEIGHARALYELLGGLTERDPDRIAYDRTPQEYRHARLLDHPRTDWAFTIARRYLYETADAVRLEALAESSFQPLAALVGKLRREERYHLMHLDAWLRRLAQHAGEPRERLIASLERLSVDAGTVFTPLASEAVAVESGLLAAPMADLHGRWVESISPVFADLRLPLPSAPPPPDGRVGHGADFEWLWNEFTLVSRSEAGATW